MKEGNNVDSYYCEAMPPDYSGCISKTYADLERTQKTIIDKVKIYGVCQKILPEKKRTGNQCKVCIKVVYKSQ